jgi:hypothetical protein
MSEQYPTQYPTLPVIIAAAAERHAAAAPNI